MTLRVIAMLFTPLLLVAGVVTIERLIDNTGEHARSEEVVTVVHGPNKPVVVAAPPSQPMSVGLDVFSPKASAELGPTVTADTPATDPVGEHPSLNSDAIVRVSDQPFPDEVVETDAALPKGVLTPRGY